MVNGPFTEEDQGKRVVDADGNKLGVISGVRGRTAYVNPNPGIGGRILSKLGWDNVDEADYPLDGNQVEMITDDEIRLKPNLY